MANWHIPPGVKVEDDCWAADDVSVDMSVMMTQWYLPPVKQEYGDMTDYDASGCLVFGSSVETPPWQVNMDTRCVLCMHTSKHACYGWQQSLLL